MLSGLALGFIWWRWCWTGPECWLMKILSVWTDSAQFGCWKYSTDWPIVWTSPGVWYMKILSALNKCLAWPCSLVAKMFWTDPLSGLALEFGWWGCCLDWPIIWTECGDEDVVWTDPLSGMNLEFGWWGYCLDWPIIWTECGVWLMKVLSGLALKIYDTQPDTPEHAMLRSVQVTTP